MKQWTNLKYKIDKYIYTLMGTMYTALAMAFIFDFGALLPASSIGYLNVGGAAGLAIILFSARGHAKELEEMEDK